MIKNPKFIEFLATGFYLGKSPKAPGTFGTLGAIPIWYLLQKVSPLASITLTMALVVLAIVIADIYEKSHLDESGAGHDRPEIVIDEIVGFLITMALVPSTWNYLVLGFILFRFFDIVKPYPISYLNDKVMGGLGVVVDDVAAGLAANILLQILSHFYAG